MRNKRSKNTHHPVFLSNLCQKMQLTSKRKPSTFNTRKIHIYYYKKERPYKNHKIFTNIEHGFNYKIYNIWIKKKKTYQVYSFSYFSICHVRMKGEGVDGLRVKGRPSLTKSNEQIRRVFNFFKYVSRYFCIKRRRVQYRCMYRRENK